MTVDFIGFLFPPRADLRVEGIRGWQMSQFHRSVEPRGQKNAHAPRAKDVGQGRYLGQILGAEDARVGVDVGERGGVDADRGAGAGVVAHARGNVVGQLVPVPQREARVAALDGAVQIVPVVEHAQAQARGACDIELVERLTGLQVAQQMEDAVEHAHVTVTDESDEVTTVDREAANDEAVLAKRTQVLAEPEPREFGRACQRTGNEQPVRPGFIRQGRRIDGFDDCAKQAPQSAHKFVVRGRKRGRRIRDGDGGEHGTGLCEAHRIRQPAIAQPKFVSVLVRRLGQGQRGWIVGHLQLLWRYKAILPSQ